MIEPRILAAIAERLAPALTAHARPAHRLLVDGVALGHFDGARMRRLAAFDDIFIRRGDDLVFVDTLRTCEARAEALERVTGTLAREGALTAWRNERYAAAAAWGAPAAFMLERAAARYFGIHTYAAHANGLVVDGPGTRMWLARRSHSKAIDPSMLDNLVGGGIPAGEDAEATLVREAWEEAGIARDIASQARRAASVYVERTVPDGLQRETIFAYDLTLPASFIPSSHDGEAVEHRCVDLREAARLISLADGPDVVTVDASLVTLDCLLRAGVVAPDAPKRRALEALCRAPSG
ncbi:MAG TPA: DUF4743 domain-containing protein [Casimicrobiaceae bacterium]